MTTQQDDKPKRVVVQDWGVSSTATAAEIKGAWKTFELSDQTKFTSMKEIKKADK